MHASRASGWRDGHRGQLAAALPATQHTHTHTRFTCPLPPACRLYAAAWRRHAPVLRVVLLFYIYSLPILTSIDAMHAISPAPSKVSQQPLSAAAKAGT